MMTAIPKPKHCGQNWLDMVPTQGGRICRQCDKKIVDFSKSSWVEIENRQKEHNNSLCGMYNPRQLENWGREIPKSGNALLKAAVITGLTVSIATASYGQNNTDSLVIEGRVTDKETGEELPFALVRLKSSSLKTATDMDGNFRLVLKNIPSTSMPDTLEIDYAGYSTQELVFSDLKALDNALLQNRKLNISMTSESEIIAFYVHMPTRKERINRKIRSWFRKSE